MEESQGIHFLTGSSLKLSYIEQVILRKDYK
jgi:hypothetical protein